MKPSLAIAVLLMLAAPRAWASTWYLDSDGDGYGDAWFPADAAAAPPGYVANSTDCDDSRAASSPAVTETCSGYDDDCDGAIDETGCPYSVAQNTHAYMFVTASANWATQQATCNSYGYMLAEIADYTENMWIDVNIDAISGSWWWVGLNDISSEGTRASGLCGTGMPTPMATETRRSPARASISPRAT